MPRTTLNAFLAAVFALAVSLSLAGPSAYAAEDWAGKYKTVDTQGNDMSITLAEDGTAKGERAGKALSGTWKSKDGKAMIDWQDDWITTLAKDGDTYTKTATKGGEPRGDAAAAEKVE